MKEIIKETNDILISNKQPSSKLQRSSKPVVVETSLTQSTHYKIIYADPPWAYKVWSKKGQGRSAESHYKTMNLDDICNLKIDKIADENSVLLMWATAPCLEQAFKVLSSWGFTYKTVAFTWIKQNKKQPTLFWGMGYYTRANAEFCLLATRR